MDGYFLFEPPTHLVPPPAILAPPDFFTQSLVSHVFDAATTRYMWSCILKQNVDTFIPNYTLDPYPRWTLGHGPDAPTLDYQAIFDDTHGPVMPMHLWQPRFAATREQHVHNSPLCRPIYFYREDLNEIGITLQDAVEKRCRSLSHWFDSVDFGGKATTHIRIWAKGYPTFAKQLQIRDETPARCPLRLEKVAQHVGKIVGKWVAEASTQRMGLEDGDPRWRIGPDAITERDIVILGIVNVSAGTWMPILRLNRPLPPIAPPSFEPFQFVQF